MKKVCSLLFAITILLSGVHVTVSTHFCGGKVAASGISLSGKLVSCGMEGNEDACPIPGHNLTTHCCDDIVSVYGLNNNFASTASLVPESYQNIFQIISIAAVYPVHSVPDIKSIQTNVSPPGVLMSTSVDLSDICIFRI